MSNRHKRNERRPIREYVRWYFRLANSDFRMWVGTYIGFGGLVLFFLYGIAIKPFL